MILVEGYLATIPHKKNDRIIIFAAVLLRAEKKLCKPEGSLQGLLRQRDNLDINKVYRLPLI